MELSSQFYGPQLKGQQEAAIERRSQDFTGAAAKSVQIGQVVLKLCHSGSNYELTRNINVSESLEI